MANVLPIYQNGNKAPWPLINVKALCSQLQGLGITRLKALVVKGFEQDHHIVFSMSDEMASADQSILEHNQVAVAVAQLHTQLIVKTSAWRNQPEPCSEFNWNLQEGYFLCAVESGDQQLNNLVNNAYAWGDGERMCTAIDAEVYYRLLQRIPTVFVSAIMPYRSDVLATRD